MRFHARPLDEAARGRSSADHGHAMEAAAARRPRTTLPDHVMSLHSQMQAMRRAGPPRRAEREFGGDNKGVGTRLSAHYSTLLGEAIGYLSRYVCQAP
ncbi:hypothetical protein CBM2587_A150092 [Cupriavidus taiwanensis]|uniref:Uncharacterized protein n=1 Tax=Cupriavidus taiwanensis TaxID=164546 RepID=A0A975WV66_9BURK|nr:hypothetical protein CBM2587_A150092 [Cupriavidus taiwanensis]